MDLTRAQYIVAVARGTRAGKNEQGRSRLRGKTTGQQRANGSERRASKRTNFPGKKSCRNSAPRRAGAGIIKRSLRVLSLSGHVSLPPSLPIDLLNLSLPSTYFALACVSFCYCTPALLPLFPLLTSLGMLARQRGQSVVLRIFSSLPSDPHPRYAPRYLLHTVSSVQYQSSETQKPGTNSRERGAAPQATRCLRNGSRGQCQPSTTPASTLVKNMSTRHSCHSRICSGSTPPPSKS